MNTVSLVALVGIPILTQSVSAALFEFDLVRRDNSDLHQSMTVDSTTGKYYQRSGLGFTGQTVSEFDNAAAFDANNPSRTVTLEGGYYGTYVAAQNGSLFGRSQLNGDFTGSDSSRFNLGSGSIEHTQPFSNVGRNGDDTFAWGGLTSMNFYNDPSGLFLLGKSDAPGGQTWQLSRIDADLNILESKSFVTPEIGYAVMIAGQLFIGQHTFDINGDLVTDGFSTVFDYDDGTYESVNHAFSALGGVQYIDNMVYDYNLDTLYVHNRAGEGQSPAFYKMGDVSKVLSGEIVHSVPETLSTVACLGLAAFGMLLISRPARFAKS